MRSPLIQCVLVLYNQRPFESKALAALLDICKTEPAIARQVTILVQDNSPQTQKLDQPIPYVCVEHRCAPDNPGLADAYNHSLQLACERGIPWLLLLDQDTVITTHYMFELLETIRTQHKSCCALVPQLIGKGLVLSPQYVGKIFYERMPRGFSGLAPAPVVAFNSAACIQVQILLEIGGFPGEFWLDYLDHMIFHSLQKTGGRIFILNAQLDHGLSLVNIEDNVSSDRYQNLLRAEWMFVRMSRWGGGTSVHRIRLLKRALSHFVKLRSKVYALQAFRAAFFWD